MQPYGTLKGLEQSMNPQLIRYSRETDISIAHSRRENRHKIYKLYPHLISPSKSPISSPEHAEPYKEIFGQRILLRCESIKFKLQTADEKENLCQVEPYHTSVCLFDARNGRKLTENFHFDVNERNTRNMLPVPNGIEVKNNVKIELPAGVPDEWLMFPKQAVFSVSNPHPDVFLVVRIEKVLQGGICQSAEPYVKASKDPKIGVKVYKSIVASCQRLGHYRMPFAWAARPLYRLATSAVVSSYY